MCQGIGGFSVGIDHIYSIKGSDGLLLKSCKVKVCFGGSMLIFSHLTGD